MCFSAWNFSWWGSDIENMNKINFLHLQYTIWSKYTIQNQRSKYTMQNQKNRITLFAEILHIEKKFCQTTRWPLGWGSTGL